MASKSPELDDLVGRKYQHGFVTVGDLLKQVATTFATSPDDGGEAVSSERAEERVIAFGKNQRATPPAAGPDAPPTRR